MRKQFLAGLGCTVIVAALIAGCGGGSSSSSTTSSGSAETGAPPELAGTYDMTVKSSDLPKNPPPELTDGSNHWILKIENTGGVSNGPGLTISNSKLGALTTAGFTIDGDSLLTQDEECGAGAAALVKSEYGWEVSGPTLRFTTVHNGCSDGVTEFLLTDQPWQKRG